MPEQRDNSGVAFKNEDRKSERHPVYSGPGQVDGKPCRIALWVNESKKTGKKFIGWQLQFEDDQDQRSPAERTAEQPDDWADDAPF